jgi:hypothetical protein
MAIEKQQTHEGDQQEGDRQPLLSMKRKWQAKRKWGQVIIGFAAQLGLSRFVGLSPFEWACPL